ncbi:MAG TPA: VOC family protein [Rhabdaerophilum sp.]|nr:VOC family protein [Rhabdaerophilum sp.]
MKLGWVIHYVQDVAATLAFYEKAFGFERAMLTEGGEFGMLRTGETTLAFCAETFLAADGFAGYVAVRPSLPPPGNEIGLVTEDVAGAYARAVEAGAMPLMPPKEKPWGQVVSYVRDCNGFLVEICSPVE